MSIEHNKNGECITREFKPGSTRVFLPEDFVPAVSGQSLLSRIETIKKEKEDLKRKNRNLYKRIESLYQEIAILKTSKKE